MTVPTTSVQAVDASISAQADQLVELYKDIHQHPELGFMEVRTAAIVADALRDLGFEVTTGIGRTGVAAVLRNGDGPTVMYRADMDANAVAEASGFDYASTVRVVREDGTESPVAHMCGHDAHVVWMLGMARFLAEHRDLWTGTAVLIGQPAEEPITGAKAMVADGLYDVIPKPDHFIGIHTAPIPVGMVVSAPGVLMAGTDQIDITIHGVGGHGSMPQLTKDPVLMAALAVTQYQSIVSRTITPQETAVLTVGSVQAGADNNVIPSSALIKANIRWFEESVREKLLNGIHAITDAIATAYEVPDTQRPEYALKGGSTPLVNDEALAGRLADTFASVLGEQAVIREFPAVTGSEDVHLLRGPHDEIDFTYLVVGVADPAACAAARARGDLFPYSPHSPDFVVELDAIALGARLASYAMLELLRR
ncbi:MAG: amidohydrolase [Microbacterium sp.]|jgi:hippurate hydrolase|nr:amidohydrolase [Microbacterium sp.]